MKRTKVPRIGVIGAGYWGAKVVRVCAELGMLACVCESDAGARERVATQYPHVPIVRDPAAIFASDIDGVAIATPPATHVELALEAIAAGKHVFVEKPLALHVEDAWTVTHAARAGGRMLVTGHLLRYHPAVVRAHALIASGAIGTLRHVRAQRVAFGRLRANENVWWSLAPHAIALVLAFLGDDPAAVSGTMHAFVRPEIADIAYADLAFEGGRSAHVEVNWLDPNKRAVLDLFGSTGVLRFSDAPGEATLTITPCGSALDAHGTPELWREEAHPIAFEAIEPLRAEFAAFGRALATGEPPPTEGDEGARVVAVLAALERANASRHVIPAEALL
ncbi:MAG: Gfo/Idh/MocA family oxidoreductase [bacterium]|nr:Gfo/Idh/MocA family oxidoreductase [bacterium]